MPIYEYECPKCGVIEVMQNITEAPIQRCPECRRKVKRLISLNNFHLKGVGWYATDYAAKSNDPDDKQQKKDKDKPETKGDSDTTEKAKPKDTQATSTTSD